MIVAPSINHSPPGPCVHILHAPPMTAMKHNGRVESLDPSVKHATQ